MCTISLCIVVCVCVYRRNTSVDESYEWDAAEHSVDLDILEAMKMERPHAGFGRGREFRKERPRSTAGLQDFPSKRKNTWACLFISHTKYNGKLSFLWTLSVLHLLLLPLLSSPLRPVHHQPSPNVPASSAPVWSFPQWGSLQCPATGVPGVPQSPGILLPRPLHPPWPRLWLQLRIALKTLPWSVTSLWPIRIEV